MKQQARTYNCRQIASGIISCFTGTNGPIKIYNPTKKDSIGLLIKIWETVNPSQIQNAWNLAIYDRKGALNDDV